MKILLVDDDPTIVLLATQVLRAAGFEVAAASSCADAVAAARVFRPDALLLDARLEDADGIVLLRALHAADVAPHVPAIFLTALTASEQHAALRSAGAVGVITKPFDPDRLAPELRHILGEAT